MTLSVSGIKRASMDDCGEVASTSSVLEICSISNASDSSSQFPLIPVVTSTAFAPTVVHISRAPKVSTTTLPTRRARKKSSHATHLIDSGPATREDSSHSPLMVVHEDSTAAESPVRSDGLTESEDMMDEGQSVAQVLMDSFHETAVENFVFCRRTTLDGNRFASTPRLGAIFTRLSDTCS